MKLIRRAKDGIWMLDRRAEGLGRVSTGQRDKPAAILAAQKIIAGRNSDTRGAVSGHTLSDALNDIWESRWKNSKSSYEQAYTVEIIRRKWGDDPVQAVTYRRIDEWVRQLVKARIAPATVNKYLSAISLALKGAAQRGHLENVPQMPRLPVRNTKVRYLTAEEETALRRAMHVLNVKPSRPQGGGTAAYPDGAAVMDAVVTALIHTGVRRSELLKVRSEDIIRHTLVLPDTKNGRARGVPLTPEAEVALLWLLKNETWQQLTDGCIESIVRLRSAGDWLTKRFAQVCGAARLEGVTLHILRHTTASRMVQAGVDRYQVQKILGHSSPAVTERYAHLDVEHLRGAVSVLSTPTVPQVKDAKVVHIGTRRGRKS